MTACTVPGCTGVHEARGYCQKHYRRWKRHGDPNHQPTPRSCTIPDCDRPHRARGWCDTHYAAWKRNGDPTTRHQAPHGTGTVHPSGYRYIRVPGRGSVAEHRLVVEEHLGRRLRPDESVHHVNGDRLDNRLSNLEVWSTSQPRGQRVDDKVTWAITLLDRYLPEHPDLHPQLIGMLSTPAVTP